MPYQPIISKARLEQNLKGEKDGYTIQSIDNISPRDAAELTGTPKLSLHIKKAGDFTATLTLAHAFYADVTLTGAQFTIKNNAPLSINDPLYKDQWYLKNTGQFGGTSGVDIKIEPVWQQGYTGKGINVAVLDEALGLKSGAIHEDLKDNIAVGKSKNWMAYAADGDCDGHHGTNVAGVIAARDNHLGTRGIAPRATIYGYGILTDKGTDDDIAAEALTKHILEIAVSNNSWGKGIIQMDPKQRTAMEKGLRDGFYGKGTVYVFAAGNVAIIPSTVTEGSNNFYGSIIVNSLDNDGTHKKQSLSRYSYIPADFSIGSNLWISAPGYKMTAPGDPTEFDCNGDEKRYSNEFKATSSAAPVISGVAALIREVNKNLTWRDVKLLLAESATKNDPTHSGWKQGYLKKSDNSHFYFNQEYGFGMVNAEQAIKLAKTWTNLPKMQTKTFSSANLDVTIGANVKENTITVQNSGIQFIESVVVEVELEKRTGIEFTKKFELTVTKNTTSSTLFAHGKRLGFTKTGDQIWQSKSKMTLTMLTNRYLGDSADGTWKISLRDTDIFTKLKSWKLIIRGH